MRMKTRMRSKPSARAKKPTRLAALTKAIGGRTIFLAVLGVMATAMLIAARQESQPMDTASVVVPREMPAAAKKPASSRASATVPAPARRPSADAPETIAPAPETESTAPLAKSAPVTITGCLERSDETFRLKDTAGADAPKSRSWKSGFLRKASASIEVVDAAHRLKLPDHVGQRVSVTGRLVDREMQVGSLQRIAASCS
jgi:hypothetical protein